MVRVSAVIESPTSPERALIRRAQEGSTRSRDILVDRYMPLCDRVGRRFSGAQHPAEDLTQGAGIGLLKATERSDAQLDNVFSTYAHALMTGEVRRHIRDSRMVRIPRSIYEQVPRLQRKQSQLRSDLGRTPTNEELATALGVSRDDVIQLLDAATHAQHVSLDA